MKRKYSIVYECGPSGCSGYVPELPTIVVTGRSEEELLARAPEAIKFYLEALESDRSPSSRVREIEVELPAHAA